MKPLIIGESNPYGGDDYYALYPAPDGCSGHRLCCLILRMQRAHYLEVFDRCNLVQGPWSLKAARQRATELTKDSRRLILLGSKVANAFKVAFEPFKVNDAGWLVLPHPSGLCRLWQDPGAIEKAREQIRIFAPEIASQVKAGVQE